MSDGKEMPHGTAARAVTGRNVRALSIVGKGTNKG